MLSNSFEGRIRLEVDKLKYVKLIFNQVIRKPRWGMLAWSQTSFRCLNYDLKVDDTLEKMARAYLNILHKVVSWSMEVEIMQEAA